jgi:hypothetical protein
MQKINGNKVTLGAIAAAVAILFAAILVPLFLFFGENFIVARADEHTHGTKVANQHSLSGNYYLAADTKLNDLQVSGATNLCLNGYTLTISEAFSVVGTLNIYDCSDEQTGKIINGSDAMSTVNVSGILNLYSGNIVATGVGVNAIYNSGTVNIYGGSVAADASASNAIYSNATANIYGGNVSSLGDSTYAIYNNGGKLAICGGSLSGVKGDVYTTNAISASIGEQSYSGNKLSIFLKDASLGNIAIENVATASRSKFKLLNGTDYMLNYSDGNLVVGDSSTHTHDYEVTTRVESTCVKAGYELYECYCGADYTVELELAAHTISDVSATITKTYVAFDTIDVDDLQVNAACTVCGDSDITDVTVTYNSNECLHYGDNEVTIICKAFGSEYSTTATVVVNKKLIAVPAADETKYVYNGTEQSYNLQKSAYYALTNDVRTLAGSQTVTVSLTDTNNCAWTDGSQLDREYAFVIDKAALDLPTIVGKIYTGKTLAADLEESGLYTVTENYGGADVGCYDVKFLLSDTDNYMWRNFSGAEAVSYFFITQATNEITSAEIADFVSGATAEPVASALFGTVKFAYCATQYGEYSSTAPTEAGAYYLKAYVDGTKNYSKAEKLIRFTITEAIVDDVVDNGGTAEDSGDTETVDGIAGTTDTTGSVGSNYAADNSEVADNVTGTDGAKDTSESAGGAKDTAESADEANSNYTITTENKGEVDFKLFWIWMGCGAAFVVISMIVYTLIAKHKAKKAVREAEARFFGLK